jgi:DNA-binding LytR/AlgR family response regulator
MQTYQTKGKRTLLIINHKTSKKVLVQSVILLKGEVNYTTLFMEDGQKKTIPHTLKFFETFLETHGFLRVHRSFMVNPNHIKSYSEEHDVLMMTNGEKANISRRRRGVLKQMKPLN